MYFVFMPAFHVGLAPLPEYLTAGAGRCEFLWVWKGGIKHLLSKYGPWVNTWIRSWVVPIVFSLCIGCHIRMKPLLHTCNAHLGKRSKRLSLRRLLIPRCCWTHPLSHCRRARCFQCASSVDLTTRCRQPWCCLLILQLPHSSHSVATQLPLSCHPVATWKNCGFHSIA